MEHNYLIDYNHFQDPIEFSDFYLFQLGRIICNENTFYANHYHNNYHELTIVTGGEGILSANNCFTKVKQGDIYFSPMHDVHSVISNKTNHLQYDFLSFYPKDENMKNALDNLISHLSVNDRVFHSSKINALISQALNEMHDYGNNKFAAPVINGIFWQIAVCILRSFKTTPPPKLNSIPNNTDDKIALCYRIMDYISSNTENIRSLNELCDVFNFSYNYISALFKKTTSVKLLDFYNMQRLNTAKTLIVENELTLEQIAEKINFSSAFALSKAFKQHYGVSPKTYRELNK